MKLRLFTKEVQSHWISQGYESVRITASDQLSVNDEPEPFFLLEPHNHIIHGGDRGIVQNIGADTVEEIIQHKTGRCYQ